MEKKDSPFPKINKKYKKKFNKCFNNIIKLTTVSLATIGVITIFIVIGITSLFNSNPKSISKISPNSVLEINFDKAYNEVKSDDLLTEISATHENSYIELLKSINFATQDKNITTIFAKINNSGLGLAQIQNIRRAIKEFQSKGKKAYIYSPSFGSFGGGLGEYYLASSFENIILQPNGEVGITGINFELPFAKNTLEKIGLETDFETRYEFKTAASHLTNNKMTNPQREELTKLGDSLFETIINDIAKDRSLTEEKIISLIDNAPIFANLALNEKLVDSLSFQNIAKSEFKKDNFIKVEEYIQHIKNREDNIKNNNQIAVISAEGEIRSGYNDNDFEQNANIYADSFIKNLDKISENKNLKALIVRLNSPGGSYTASNEIWSSILKLKEEKKIPVIFSFGDYAASGGYFMGLSADYILAEPSTITGSIGVLGGKIVATKLWEKIGLNWESIKFGKNSDILSTNHKFTDQQRAVFNKSLDNVYTDFTNKVSKYRKISIEDLDELARGRVWTGIQAKENNLIDEIGGYEKAVNKAVELSSIEAGEKFSLIYYPKEKTFQEKLNDFLGGGEVMVSINQLVGFKPNKIIESQTQRHLNNIAILPQFSISH